MSYGYDFMNSNDYYSPASIEYQMDLIQRIAAICDRDTSSCRWGTGVGDERVCDTCALCPAVVSAFLVISQQEELYAGHCRSTY